MDIVYVYVNLCILNDLLIIMIIIMFHPPIYSFRIQINGVQFPGYLALHYCWPFSSGSAYDVF